MKKMKIKIRTEESEDDVQITLDQVELIMNLLNSTSQDDREMAKGILEAASTNHYMTHIIFELIHTNKWKLEGEYTFANGKIKGLYSGDLTLESVQHEKVRW